MGSFDNPFVNWDANGYRLPTEGEWQYAASYKNGTDWTPFDHASGATASHTNAPATDAVAWYPANAGSKTHQVGTKAANALGIYDMSGNLYEWCWDWDGDWSTEAKTNFRGPESGSRRILRGGSYFNEVANL